MKPIQTIAAVLLTTTLTAVLVLGSFQMSFAEGNPATTPAATQTPTDSITIINSEDGNELTKNKTTPLVQVVTQTPTPTMVNTLAVCPPPENWQPYSIQIGDSLESLSSLYGISEEEIKQANCLEIDSLIPGSFIYLPPLEPTSTAANTPVVESTLQCGPPDSWVIYIIQSNDTLFQLSILFNVSVPQLQFANCMGNSTRLITGTRFYVPYYLPTIIPRTATAAPTMVITPFTVTNTSTIPAVTTPAPSLTNTSPAASTATNSPTNTMLPPTPTAIPTMITTTVPAPSATPLPPTVTPTITPSNGNTPTNTPTPTVKPS